MGQAQMPFQDVLKKLEKAQVSFRWSNETSREISLERPSQRETKAIEDLGGKLVRKGEYTFVYKFE